MSPRRLAPNQRGWLWVPACAGTTEGFLSQPGIEQRQADQRGERDQGVADAAKSFLAGEAEHARAEPQPDAEGRAGEKGETDHGGGQDAATEIAHDGHDAGSGKEYDDV